MSTPTIAVARGRGEDLGTIVRTDALTLPALADLMRAAQQQPALSSFEVLCEARASLAAAKAAREEAAKAGRTAEELKTLRDTVRAHQLQLDGLKRTPWVCFATFNGPARRREAILTSSAFVGDADHGAQLQKLVQDLDRLGCAYLVHTSTSHGCEGIERYRVIVPFAQPLEHPLRRYPKVWKFFSEALSGVLDPGAKDATRLSYMPRIPTGAAGHTVICVADRPWFDARPVLGAIEPAATPDSPAESAPLSALSAEQEADLRAALSHPAMLDSLGDNSAWSDVGYALLSLGAKGFEIFDWISRQAPNYEEGAPESWWSAHASAVPQSDYRAIFKRAAELGWQNPATARTASPEAFPAVPAAPAADAPASAETPAVTRLWQQLQTGAKGVILGNLFNARLVLEFLDKPQVPFDQFDRKIYVRWADEPDRRPLQDADVLRVQIALQKFGLRSVSAQTARDAVALCAEQRRTDRLADWLNSFVWDGTRRLSLVMPRGFGTPGSKYYLRAGRNLFLSMVARGLKPGCQVDEALVLEGPQGSLKSSALRIIGGELFAELTADPRSKDFEQQLTGVWLGEFSELNALRRVEDIARIKQFVTNRTDHYRPPYGREPVDVPRRTVLCGSTNECEWLHDPTGGRRFIPIEVGRIDLTWLQTNREQLFAEAVALVKAGRKWWIYPKVETAEKQEERAPEDPWTERIRDYLYGRSEIVDVAKLLADVVRMPIERQSKAALTRVGIILRQLGCTQRTRRRINKRLVRPWTIPDGLATAQQVVPDAPGFWPVGSAPNSNSSVHAAGGLA